MKSDTGSRPSTAASIDAVQCPAAVGSEPPVGTAVVLPPTANERDTSADIATDGVTLQPSPAAWSPMFLAECSLWFTALAWGSNLLIVKMAMGHLNPWVFNSTRLLFATLALGILSGLEQRFRRPPLGALPWRALLWFAAFNGLFYQVFFVMGISRTTAGNTALLLSSMPMWTAVMSFLWLRERLPWQSWLGLMVTFSGTVFVLMQNGNVDLSGNFFWGNVFVVGGAMMWAASTVCSRPLLQVITPLRLAFWSSLLTLPAHAVLCWPYLYESLPELIQFGNVVAILFSGCVSTGIAYATWHYGVRQLGGSRAAVYQNLVTLVAVIGGWIFLFEPVLLAQFVGGLAIICGLFLMRIRG